jgi:hypothetical protein
LKTAAKYFRNEPGLVTFLVIVMHIAITGTAYFILYHYGIFKKYPDADNIAKWDAGILATIRNNGYFFQPGGPWNTGMFPLFPYIWRWTQLGAVGISILNYIIMLASFWWLAKTFRFPPLLQFWLLAIPSMLFFYLPYSEAFFFLSTTLILAGVHKNNSWMTALGIYLAMLSRGTGLFFIPLVILLEWMEDFNFRKETLIAVAKKSFLPVMAVVAGIATIAIIQWMQTGYAFSFLYVQTTGTGKHFHSLRLPIVTWYQVQNLWMDGMAAVTGLFITLMLLFTLNGKPDKFEAGQPVTWTTRVVRFSMLYIVIQVWYVLLNAPIYIPTNSVSVMSLGRYVFCNPFWMIFAYAVATRPRINTLAFIFSLFIVFLLICLMGARRFFEENSFWGQFSDPAFFYRVSMLLLALPLFFANRTKASPFFFIAGYLFLLYIQFVLLNAFIGKDWVG